MPRKVICYIATSADGYIARPDGTYDWLEKERGTGERPDYGFPEFVATVDTVIWGRTTWDQVQGWLESDPNMSQSTTKNYVFTSRPEAQPPKQDVVYTNEPVKPFMERLRAEEGKDIWMMGGGKTIAAFLDAGEIDEFIIHVMPVFLGGGIPLIGPLRQDVEMKLLATKSYQDLVVMLHYRVLR
jgi:dihydrofolate reductase